MNSSYLEFVSIGMPVYNDEKYLPAALDSLLAQTYANFELIISDDCSSDGSSEICKQYAEKDNRIKYIRQQSNIGISRNMEFLLNAARGVYFMWAANDDIWHKDFIKVLHGKLSQNPKAILAFCRFAQITETGEIVNNGASFIEDYEGQTAYVRLRSLIRKKSDGCGYGLFRRAPILDVEFPVWWSVNRKCAYNNIYPTLCFYLARGEYVLERDKVLWFNRIKSEPAIHHKVPFPNHFLKSYAAFSLRKFNLVFKSFLAIYNGSKNLSLAVRLAPRLFYSWFAIPLQHPLRKFREFKNGHGIKIFIS